MNNEWKHVIDELPKSDSTCPDDGIRCIVSRCAPETGTQFMTEWDTFYPGKGWLQSIAGDSTYPVSYWMYAPVPPHKSKYHN